MTLDGRALRLLVMGAWSAFFLWLWASDEILRYLGPRTEWVVPAGGIALALATIAYARTSKSAADPVRPAGRELVGACALLLPIVVAAVLSGSSLGSLAASKKLTARGVDVSALARLQADGGGALMLIDLQAGKRDPSIAAEKGVHVGRAVTLIGFVSKGSKARTFELQRFYIACCVADAIPVGVPVHAKTVPKTDSWVSVTGTIYDAGSMYGIRALRIKQIPQPHHPYLAFTT